MKYSVRMTKDDDGTLLVTFPDFEDAVTFGKDEADALAHAQDALEEVIAARIAHREAIPRPSKHKGKSAALSSRTVAKLLLYWEMQTMGLKKAELARRLHCNPKQIDRIVDPRHMSSFEQMDKAFAAMGLHMTVGIEAA